MAKRVQIRVKILRQNTARSRTQESGRHESVTQFCLSVKLQLFHIWRLRLERMIFYKGLDKHVKSISERCGKQEKKKIPVQIDTNWYLKIFQHVLAFNLTTRRPITARTVTPKDKSRWKDFFNDSSDFLQAATRACHVTHRGHHWEEPRFLSSQ